MTPAGIATVRRGSLATRNTRHCENLDLDLDLDIDLDIDIDNPWAD